MAANATIRVEQQTRQKLVELAKAEKKPLGQVVKEAVAGYERDRFFAQLRADLERLQSDPDAWADYQAEIRSLDGTLKDGFEENPWSE